VLAPPGLQLAPEKARVDHIDEGFPPPLPHPQDAHAPARPAQGNDSEDPAAALTHAG